MEIYQRLETLIGKKLPLYPTEKEEVMALMERVSEAQRLAKTVSCHSPVLVMKCLVLHLGNVRVRGAKKEKTKTCVTYHTHILFMLVCENASFWMPISDSVDQL